LKRSKFRWRCVYCKKLNIYDYKFQLDIPGDYEVNDSCEECGKINNVCLHLRVNYAQQKPNKEE